MTLLLPESEHKVILKLQLMSRCPGERGRGVPGGRGEGCPRGKGEGCPRGKGEGGPRGKGEGGVALSKGLQCQQAVVCGMPDSRC